MKIILRKAGTRKPVAVEVTSVKWPSANSKRAGEGFTSKDIQAVRRWDQARYRRCRKRR